MTAARSQLEMLFAEQVRTARLPRPTREHVFHDTRKWRFDFAWPEHAYHARTEGVPYMLLVKEPIAVEIEGGTWIGGAHNRGKHFESDCEKYAEAAIAGWRVLRVTTDMVSDGRAIALLRRLFTDEA